MAIRTERLLLTLSFLWACTILALGSWWLYLIVKFSERIGELENVMGGAEDSKLMVMVKWEGGAFFVLLTLLSLTLLFLYLKDQKKTKALQDFFASLTHELKTPLASVRLQAEVIHDVIEEKGEEKLHRLSDRLIEDTLNLETQMDKILQLSRLERGGNLNPVKVNLESFLNKTKERWEHDLDVKIKNELSRNDTILADELALELIFRNLFENTKKHANSNEVTITLSEEGDFIKLTYSDGGEFKGEPKKIGKLFYKHSSKGSGIGLYLVKSLMSKMDGNLEVNLRPLTFDLLFKKGGH